MLHCRVPLLQLNELKIDFQRDAYRRVYIAYKRYEFRKNCANESPLTGKFMGKIPNFDSFGGCVTTVLPSPCRISWGNVSPLYHIFVHFFVYSRRATNNPHHNAESRLHFVF